MQGIFIPTHILQDNSLSLQEKLILSLVTNFKDNGCYMSNQSISDLIGLSASRVSHIISALVKKGYCAVALQYKPNSKQVSKRTVSLTQVAQAVKKAVSNVINKAKELKQQYTLTKQQVGTQQVEQVTFSNNAYKHSNSHSKPYTNNNDKIAKFNNMYSRDWDFDEIERLEQEYIDRKIAEMRGDG